MRTDYSSAEANSLLADVPAPPVERDPTDWEHSGLYGRVRTALQAVPDYFTSELVISGVLASDLFTFNSSLGATIEAQVVGTLNRLRDVWDPDKTYHHYQFIRQAQQFPDVILQTSLPNINPSILLGIELKGWYALAKEGEPSFRFGATPAVCAPWDFLVVYPWTLSQVISGTPKLFSPYVIGSLYAAEYRNWYWTYADLLEQAKQLEASATGSRPKGARGKPKRRQTNPHTVILSSVTGYYPSKDQKYNDTDKIDKDNFGRFARTNLMDLFKERLFRQPLAGILLGARLDFFRNYGGEKPTRKLEQALERLHREAPKAKSKDEPLSKVMLEELREHLIGIVALLESDI